MQTELLSWVPETHTGKRTSVSYSRTGLGFHCSTNAPSVSLSAPLGGRGALIKRCSSGGISVMLLGKICRLCKCCCYQWTSIHLLCHHWQTDSIYIFIRCFGSRKESQTDRSVPPYSTVAEGEAVCLSFIFCCLET